MVIIYMLHVLYIHYSSSNDSLQLSLSFIVLPAKMLSWDEDLEHKIIVEM